MSTVQVIALTSKSIWSPPTTIHTCSQTLLWSRISTAICRYTTFFPLGTPDCGIKRIVPIPNNHAISKHIAGSQISRVTSSSWRDSFCSPVTGSITALIISVSQLIMVGIFTSPIDSSMMVLTKYGGNSAPFELD